MAMRKIRTPKKQALPDPAEVFGKRDIDAMIRRSGPSALALQLETAMIRERERNPDPGSYTSQLLADPRKIRKKVIEESVELITARGERNLIWEAADLLYFVQLYLVNRGVRIEDVLGEILRRTMTKKKGQRYPAIP